ncbi:hypothetical protein SLEP1_g59073 [Rubroshorea leprosula]|uniref:Uncharacterized protein n=1 Tax=Rubroshorea leprosula TaxID=152421 RepID=A0AAV5MVU7_9ROSI|nr:hypothetical protein SLEP1_g59073 [Rubroshorea leprosula]
MRITPGNFLSPMGLWCRMCPLTLRARRVRGALTECRFS